MMEYKFNKPIDELILDSLINSSGAQNEASQLLDISESALCRWIQELDLNKEVSQIRKNNNRPPTIGDLRIKISDGRELVEVAIIKRCSDCNAKFEDFISHTVTAVDKKDEEIIAVVRDELNRKHWFALDMSQAIA